jgi:hypothetical protein
MSDEQKQAVIVVWDKTGKFFQNWTAEFKNGDGIEHGKRIAAQIGGSYAVVGDWSTDGTLDAEMDRVAVDYPGASVMFVPMEFPEPDSVWECRFMFMTMIRGEMCRYQGQGATKIEALRRARREPDEEREEAARRRRAQEEAKALEEARQKRLDDQVFDSI